MDDTAGAIEGEGIALSRENDIILVQQRTAHWSRKAGLSAFITTRLMTAASEIARNTVIHGGGGWLRIELFQDAVRMSFVDRGPGIADVSAAMRDGFSTKGGMGLGLPGTKRLVDFFHMESHPGQGTTVNIGMMRRA